MTNIQCDDGTWMRVGEAAAAAPTVVEKAFSGFLDSAGLALLIAVVAMTVYHLYNLAKGWGKFQDDEILELERRCEDLDEENLGLEERVKELEAELKSTQANIGGYGDASDDCQTSADRT